MYEQRLEKELATALEKKTCASELDVTVEKVTDSKKRVEEKKSMFNDIKEVLRAVEFSKAQIEDNLADSARPRNIHFNQMNSNFSQR